MKPNLFIIRLNPADFLTLGGLAVDLAAFFLFLDLPAAVPGLSFTPALGGEQRFFLAVSLMYLGMLCDAFDGLMARRFRFESEFGRYLDGFADVFNYLILPNLALWRLGFRGPLAGVVISLMIGCGMLRLSKFNLIGNIQDKGESKYLGLPVFWSQILFLPLYLLFWLSGGKLFYSFYFACALLWVIVAAAFIYNRPFFKPKNPWIIAGVTLSLSGSAFVLFLIGFHP